MMPPFGQAPPDEPEYTINPHPPGAVGGLERRPHILKEFFLELALQFGM